jgi:hypothetical protein
MDAECGLPRPVVFQRFILVTGYSRNLVDAVSRNDD